MTAVATTRTFQISVDDIGTVHVLDGEKYLVEYELYVSGGHVLVGTNDLGQIRVHEVENTELSIKDSDNENMQRIKDG